MYIIWRSEMLMNKGSLSEDLQLQQGHWKPCTLLWFWHVAKGHSTHLYTCTSLSYHTNQFNRVCVQLKCHTLCQFQKDTEWNSKHDFLEMVIDIILHHNILQHYYTLLIGVSIKRRENPVDMVMRVVCLILRPLSKLLHPQLLYISLKLDLTTL